ncbi:hypothetical protein [uncultured Aquimarina sp.]|uniref:hypothetical protein n=1 Tax=uncultured Aquimarina sp. TaxID=575652 RepID=UPI00260752CC|nr:hypothetical protein [uncultured Aquimarina sp.]
MGNESNNIDPGQIRFLNNSVPVLTGGTYEIDVKQDIQSESHAEVKQNYEEKQSFIVQAARFSIPATTIHSQFPAPGAKEEYSQNLPFITFESEQLPWVRTLKGGTALENPPSWMALLLFEENELIYTEPKEGTASPTKTTLLPIKEAINPTDANIVGSNVTLDPIEQSKADEGSLSAYTIDVSAANFNAIAPTLAELPFLAHLREINVGQKVVDGMTGTGFFPILVGNRLPKENVKYSTHLVSLEGFGDRLPGGSAVIPNDKTVRLVSLQSWNFETISAGGNFTSLVEALDQDKLQLDFQQPTSWKEPITVAQQKVKNRYQKGYVALNSVTRLGESTFSWYRGPFVPVIPEHITNTDPNAEQALLSSDEALIYDSETGIFDQSYAAAWETGRMTTLKNATVSKAIFDWKKEGITLLKLVDTLIKEMPKGQQMTTATLNKMITESKSGDQKFMNYLAGQFGKHVTGNTSKSAQPVIAISDPTGLHKNLQSMPGLIHPDVLNNAMANGQDPHEFIHGMLRKSNINKNKKE